MIVIDENIDQALIEKLKEGHFFITISRKKIRIRKILETVLTLSVII